MTEWRRDFHLHPELGFNEYRTSSIVARLLNSFGIKVHQGIGGTGLVGILKKGESKRSIGLRADMDALPIKENKLIKYNSQKEGVMHACGHDGHMSMLLGAAKYLSETKNFEGKIVFIFQPNEEHGLGAKAMIEDGLFKKFDIDNVYGIHNIPGMPLGNFALRLGPITASESIFEIKIKAQGGHAAMPHMGVDAIIVGSEIVQTLQTIISRKIDPSLNGVVSVTEFITDGKRNVLPSSVTLRGDTRALSNGINKKIELFLRQIVEGVCLSHGVDADVIYETIFPSVINSKESYIAAKNAASKLVGLDSVDTECLPRLFSEDFSHFLDSKPGCFIFMGNGIDGSNAMPLHSSEYDFNDNALPIGSSFWVELVEQELSIS